MPEINVYPPEGTLCLSPYTLSTIKAAQENSTILEGLTLRCSESHDLTVRLGAFTGIIPRQEAVHPTISGAEREIAVLSRVGKPVCFCVTSVESDEAGRPKILLSRRAAQEKALLWLRENLTPGMVRAVRVTHLDDFGAFVDIGCGVISLLPIEALSVSRIAHPADRVRVGQRLLAVVTAVDGSSNRFYLSHKELLGTWMENASRFASGETVRGVVRSIRDYGVFVELTPNLSGLADPKAGLSEGDGVSVYIKSIQPDRMKVKLQIVEPLPGPKEPEPLIYQITDGILEKWTYSPPNYAKEPVEVVFIPAP